MGSAARGELNAGVCLPKVLKFVVANRVSHIALAAVTPRPTSTTPQTTSARPPVLPLVPLHSRLPSPTPQSASGRCSSLCVCLRQTPTAGRSSSKPTVGRSREISRVEVVLVARASSAAGPASPTTNHSACRLPSLSSRLSMPPPGGTNPGARARRSLSIPPRPASRSAITPATPSSSCDCTPATSTSPSPKKTAPISGSSPRTTRPSTSIASKNGMPS